MDKGISFYFGFKMDTNERVKILKNIGFDNVITNADTKFNEQNGTIARQIKAFNSNNIGVSSLHMRYNAPDLPYFWVNCRKGKWMLNRLVKDVKVAHKYNMKNVVVHLLGIPSLLGLKRILKVLKLCEKYDVNLAIENINNPECFEYVFTNIKHSHLKFCYDVGHNHAFDPDVDYLEKYGDKLVCLHLHDNDGTRDAHTLNKYGNIDWDTVAKKLAKIKFNGSLDYELLCPTGDEGCEEVAKEVYNQACELETMIKKYKNKRKKS